MQVAVEGEARRRELGDTAREVVATVDRYHGQASGVFSCSEHLAGLMPSQGAETCTVRRGGGSIETFVLVYKHRALAYGPSGRGACRPQGPRSSVLPASTRVPTPFGLLTQIPLASIDGPPSSPPQLSRLRRPCHTGGGGAVLVRVALPGLR
jgi:hypothetical protein